MNKRAVPELIRAYETGKLSLRRLDILSLRSKRQQKRVIAAKERENRAGAIAAQVIAEILDSQQRVDSPIRLPELGRQIAERLRHW